MRRGVVGLLLAAALAVGSAARAETFRGSTLAVLSGGAQYRFTVELAETPLQRAEGLQHRKSMAADAGMLFDFGRIQPVSMWMKNTFIPLDMLFLRADGTIAGIAENTVPHSLDIIAAPEPVRAVLELNAGTVQRLGISPGDRIFHWIFGP
ncbi:MAG: DUF192 domain-containing protein [Magnetospirillum sp. WYHS-4]